MAEKQTESICPGITGGSSLLASTYGNDFVELVWKNGQILVKGGSSSRTLKRPSRFGHSTNPSHEAYDEDHWIAKRARLNTLSPLLDSSHKNSRQANGPCSYPFDWKCTKSNGFSKPGDELSNLRAERESNSKPAGGNTQICSTSLQTHKKHDLGSDERAERINFSNFLRPALFFKSTYKGNSASQQPNSGVSARVEEIKATDGGSSKALEHSDVIDSAKGSDSLNGVHPGQTALTSNKANLATPFDGKKDQETLPDEQSEAVGCDRALKSQGSHGHYHHQTRSRKGKNAAGFSSAPFVASSSLCSLGVGASNDPSLHSRKHEDTDDSTHTSENDEETEDTTTKETPARDGSRGKRIRNTQKRNLSERKRRDEINKKMRALKKLIPDCNKMDKVSMLDDAIDYLKTLKLQLQVMSVGSGVCMPLMMSMLGIGIPCGVPPHQFLPQVPPHPHAIANNNLQMLNAGFPYHAIPNIQFPISQQSPFICMPPKPIQPYLSSHPSPFDHNSDFDAQLVSAAMPKATQASKGNADHAHIFGATCRK